MTVREALGQTRGGLRPAPLPSLQSAFARRRAIFGPVALSDESCNAPIAAAAGTTPAACVAERVHPDAAPKSPGRRLALAGAVAMLVAPMAPRPAAARGAEADVELARLAEEIDRTLDGAAYALDPVDDEGNQNRRLRHADRLILRMVDVPVVGPAGVKAKAKGYLDSLSYDVLESAALAQSLAEDAERVCGEVSA